MTSVLWPLAPPPKGEPSVPVCPTWSERHCASLGSICIQGWAARKLPVPCKCFITTRHLKKTLNNVNNIWIKSRKKNIELIIFAFQPLIISISISSIYLHTHTNKIIYLPVYLSISWRWQYFILMKSFCPMFGKQNLFFLWASGRNCYSFKVFFCVYGSYI